MSRQAGCDRAAVGGYRDRLWDHALTPLLFRPLSESPRALRRLVIAALAPLETVSKAVEALLRTLGIFRTGGLILRIEKGR